MNRSNQNIPGPPYRVPCRLGKSPVAASGILVRAVLGLLVMHGATGVGAQTTLSMNIDYAEGKYGEAEKSTTWTAPLIFKHQAGPLSVKLNVPYVRASGVAVPGGDRISSVKEIQEGWGDIVTTVLYDVHDDTSSGLVIAIGAKAKLATANHSLDLLTTGKNDYSLLVDILKPIDAVDLYGTLGRTKKGDPDGSNFADPWFSTVGFSHRLSGQTRWGLIHDYRQKLTRSGAPVSEATLFLETKFGQGYKAQGYLVRGFADASPDLGVGVTLSVRF
jgi:hypothetical protein